MLDFVKGLKVFNLLELFIRKFNIVSYQHCILPNLLSCPEWSTGYIETDPHMGGGADFLDSFSFPNVGV